MKRNKIPLFRKNPTFRTRNMVSRNKLCNYNGFTIIYQSVVWLCLVTCMPSTVQGVEPGEVLVVVNERMASSEAIGRYYMNKRAIPENHLLLLSTTVDEQIRREKFDAEIKKVIQHKLSKLQDKATNPQKSNITTIVLIYGVPLKITEDIQVDRSAGRMKRNIDQKSYLSVYDQNTDKNTKKHKDTTSASVDSELALVKLESYDLKGWIPNPYYLGNKWRSMAFSKNNVLLVTRLDGPDPDTVYQIINDTIETEKAGLEGIGYFDARGKAKGVKNPAQIKDGYKRYDYSVSTAAKIVKKRTKVVLDEQPELFKEESCPQAALYCGWYSYANYIDSFSWVKGAIGYHIASAECTTLRNRERNVWCLRMLEKGVVATIGPVYEPYVQGFPLPEIFFGTLIEGYMSLGEAYLVSLPFISWQMVLVGDPMYQPFKPMSD